MKKFLLSAAVIAISGAYVAYEDHGGVPSLSLDASVIGTPSVAYAAPAAIGPKSTTPTLDLAPAQVAPSTAPIIATLPSVPAVSKPVQGVAAAAPAPAPAGSTDTIGSIISDAAPAPVQPMPPQPASTAMTPPVRQTADLTPPLPRPRPVDAPQAGAASSTPSPQDGAIPQTVASTQGVAQSAYRDGSYKGVSADAYYGRVQVDAVISSGRLTSIKILDYPSDRQRSANIAHYSLPVLKQEAIAAQSANIDTVSGATLTSEAFMQSLDSALSAARSAGSNA